MAYDETFHKVPVFTDRELYELPQIQSGEVDLPQKYLDGAIKLERHIAGPIIQGFIQHSQEEGVLVVVKETSTVLDSNGREHEVAWCRICDESGDRHQVVCEHVGQSGMEALTDELIFACSGIKMAIRARALIVQDILKHSDAIGNSGQNYGGRRGVVNFMLAYGRSQSHNWLATHRNDSGNIEGFAALFDISEERMRRTAELMVLEGDISISGPDDQVITPLRAA